MSFEITEVVGPILVVNRKFFLSAPVSFKLQDGLLLN